MRVSERLTDPLPVALDPHLVAANLRLVAQSIADGEPLGRAWLAMCEEGAAAAPYPIPPLVPAVHARFLGLIADDFETGCHGGILARFFTGIVARAAAVETAASN
jgi:hypothetical protein